MSYNQLRRAHLSLMFCAYPIGTVASFWLAYRQGVAFLLLALVWAMLIVWVAGSLKCPRCEKPVGFGTFEVLGIEFEWWKAIPGTFYWD
jgi:hypothetical protein